jgi:large subunit ribosomal protein L19
MSGAVGVERIFPVNLPALQKLKSTKGAVRRARIFYFRQLTGKKAKLKTKKIVLSLS